MDNLIPPLPVKVSCAGVAVALLIAGPLIVSTSELLVAFKVTLPFTNNVPAVILALPTPRKVVPVFNVRVKLLLFNVVPLTIAIAVPSMIRFAVPVIALLKEISPDELIVKEGELNVNAPKLILPDPLLITLVPRISLAPNVILLLVLFIVP